MNHIETMKQALDALENSSDLVFKDLQKSHLREAAIEALRAAIAQGESEPVANLRRWMSGPELGAPERVIYAMKVLDAGRALPMGSYDMYLQPSSAPQVAGYVPLSDERIDDITKKTWPRVSDVVMPAYLAAYRGYARAIERAVMGAK